MWKQQSINVLMPQGHEHRSLLFVVGQLHPISSVNEKTQKELGRVVRIESNGEHATIVFENARMEFHKIPHVLIQVGKINQ